MSRTLKAFTIVELLVVIAIIGVMATIGIASFSRIQSNARDTQRSSKITILSEALEKYYDKNGEYPSCAAMTADSSTVTTTLKGLDPDVLTTPTSTKGTNSVLCSDPTLDTFGYLDGGSQYVLKYKAEASDTLVSLDSRRHTVTAMYTLTITAATGGTVNAGGSYTSGTIQTVTATPGTYYSFSSWTGSTGCSGLVSHTITIDANKTCTANFTPTAIAAPTTPTVTLSTVGATTTWSWGAASCPGNTARYQYRYTISSGYNSGLVATAATSVAFTTSTAGQTYTVATQAECYNTVAASGMSSAGSGSYSRPHIYGCTDPNANNYNPSATANDGSCTYSYWTLTVNTTTGGTTNQPNQAVYQNGTQVNIITSANAGYNSVGFLNNSSGEYSYGNSYYENKVLYLTVNSNITITALFASTSGYWISGPVSGIQVWSIDINEVAWGPQGVSCTLPQCNNSILVSDNGVDFSAYPARNACKSLGGRLPNYTEMVGIENNKTSYNYPLGYGHYWVANEAASDFGGIVQDTGYIGSGGGQWKSGTSNTNVRCVK